MWQEARGFRSAILCCDWAHTGERQIQDRKRGSMREVKGEYCWWRDGTSSITSISVHRHYILLSLTFNVLFEHLLGPPDSKNKSCAYIVCVCACLWMRVAKCSFSCWVWIGVVCFINGSIVFLHHQPFQSPLRVYWFGNKIHSKS